MPDLERFLFDGQGPSGGKSANEVHNGTTTAQSSKIMNQVDGSANGLSAANSITTATSGFLESSLNALPDRVEIPVHGRPPAKPLEWP